MKWLKSFNEVNYIFNDNKLSLNVKKDDKYIDVVNEMYEDNVLDDDDIEDLD